MRENASAYFIYVDIAVLLSVLSLAGRNFCMFVTKRKQERKRVRKDTHYNEQKMSRWIYRMDNWSFSVCTSEVQQEVWFKKWPDAIVCLLLYVLSDIFISLFQDPPGSVTQATSAPDSAPAEIQTAEGECPPVPGTRGHSPHPGSRGGGHEAAQAGDRALVPSGQGPGQRHRAHLRGDPRDRDERRGAGQGWGQPPLLPRPD